MLGKLICNLYALLYWQNFILGKCGVTLCHIAMTLLITKFGKSGKIGPNNSLFRTVWFQQFSEEE
jgi:hypothetical protein